MTGIEKSIPNKFMTFAILYSTVNPNAPLQRHSACAEFMTLRAFVLCKGGQSYITACVFNIKKKQYNAYVTMSTPLNSKRNLKMLCSCLYTPYILTIPKQ